MTEPDELREVLSFRPDGVGIVFTQRKWNGDFMNIRARIATPEDLQSMTSPNEQVLGRSGSSNGHARLSPSASDRWSVCTASISLEQEHAEAIFRADVDRVRRLTPYLESIPDETHPHEKRAVRIACDLAAGILRYSDLTDEQRDDIRRTESSEVAREGTRAHDFAEAVLNGRRTIDSVPGEFRHHVKGYVDYALSLVPPGETPYVEAKVPLFYSPEETGTVDFGIVTPGRICILDLKYGQGKLVKTVENTQLAIYALSFARHHEEEGLISFGPDTTVEIHVHQPRHREARDLKPWVLTLKDLEDFCREIGDKAAAIREGKDLVFAPSENSCMFCKAKAQCRARIEHAASVLDNPDSGQSHLDILEGLPSDDDIPDMTKKEFRKLPVQERLISRTEYATNGRTALLPDEVLVSLKLNAKAIRSFLDDVDEFLDGRVLAGERIEGLMISTGREGNREWADESAADTFLRGQGLKEDDRYTRKLISPTKAEELMADKLESVKRTRSRFDELVRRSPAKRVVVPDDGTREPVPAITDDLPHEDEDDGLGTDD